MPAEDLGVWPWQVLSRCARVGLPSCCPDISYLTPAELLGLPLNFMKMNGVQRGVIGERFHDNICCEQLDVCKATRLSCKRENFSDVYKAFPENLIFLYEWHFPFPSQMKHQSICYSVSNIYIQITLYSVRF